MNGVMKAPSSQRQFILITLSFVCLLGGFAVYSLLRQPRKVDARLALAKSQQRQPSSISEEAIAKSQAAAVAGKSISLSLACDVKNLGSTEGAHLRLLGQTCQTSRKKFTEVSIKNLSNGFTAEVIDLKEKGYTTDYIDLVVGDNQLLVQRKDQSGEIFEQTINIQRQPASVDAAPTANR